MSFALFPYHVTASHAPAKNASEILNTAVAPDLVKKTFSASDKLLPEKSSNDATQEKTLKKIVKEKRKIEWMAMAGMLTGAALALYKRQAIASGFQKLFAGKPALKPARPAPEATTVTMPKPLSEVELEKTVEHSQ